MRFTNSILRFLAERELDALDQLAGVAVDRVGDHLAGVLAEDDEEASVRRDGEGAGTFSVVVASTSDKAPDAWSTR